MSKELTNKPLVEAIFELKWKLQKSENGGLVDPKYKILVGMLYDKLKKDYPYFEKLPAADMPDEMTPYIVQNRFRAGEGEWPLVQIGPGIITLNDTENYRWEDFEQRILNVLEVFVDIYPNTENLIFNSLLLRYIDSIMFNFDKDDIFLFLSEKMHTNIEIYKKLFEDTGVMDLPIGFDLKTSFSSTKPKGAMMLRFARGKFNDIDKLAMETMVFSLNEDVPVDKEMIPKWIGEAHNLLKDWFFKLIEGDLLEEFG